MIWHDMTIVNGCEWGESKPTNIKKLGAPGAPRHLFVVGWATKIHQVWWKKLGGFGGDEHLPSGNDEQLAIENGYL